MSQFIILSGKPLNAISSEVSYEICTLLNGIRLVHQQTNGPVSYFALLAGTGSRHENKDEYGAAHLMEHLIFKETHHRKSYHILSRLEDVGGDLNAYTTKEDTCIHATFLNNYYDRALELISDIMFNHKITDKTLELEKRVVLDEIKANMDSPVDLIYDEFDELLLPNHPLGHGTLGSVQSLKKLDKTTLTQFVEKNYGTGQMVLSSVGNIAFDKLKRIVEKHFGHIPPKQSLTKATAFPSLLCVEKRINKKNHQSHCIMGQVCDSTDRQYRLGMTMLSSLLGGPGMNTRLNMSLRERHGWVYNVEASYTPYLDIGIFSIYFATSRTNLDKCITQVQSELRKLQESPLSNTQLKKLQHQMIGQLAIASDNYDARMFSAGKSLLMYDKIDTLSEICDQINQITTGFLQKIAGKTFRDLSLLAYQ